MRLPNSLTILVLVAAAFGFAALWDRTIGLPGFWIALAAIVALLLWRGFNAQSASQRWLVRAADRPVVLQPPFRDRWWVAAGGPDPRHNHHQSVSDQYFAYDFLRESGDSWDQPILAPCDGMVAHVENRQDDAPPAQRRRNRARPFGNYVSIETPRGYVLLAHLRKGSIGVRVGETVRAGDEIGRCGNSGDTRGAHLHVHAQNQPSQGIDSAQGVPIAFLDRGATEPMLLEYRDRLG
ncbi:MAG TPA: M23 family metallopeptidase [Candidatus Baltobacteraceae bacterium]|nr:M23 family metallopeptidase [Candidatus Baltobacteraceae bacterium]